MIEEIFLTSSYRANHSGIKGTYMRCYGDTTFGLEWLRISSCISRHASSVLNQCHQNHSWKPKVRWSDHNRPYRTGKTGLVIGTLQIHFLHCLCNTLANFRLYTISKIMHKCPREHGVPKGIVSDNGPDSLHSSTRLYGALFGLPYECKNTGEAERTNKRLN